MAAARLGEDRTGKRADVPDRDPKRWDAPGSFLGSWSDVSGRMRPAIPRPRRRRNFCGDVWIFQDCDIEPRYPDETRSPGSGSAEGGTRPPSPERYRRDFTDVPSGQRRGSRQRENPEVLIAAAALPPPPV